MPLPTISQVHIDRPLTNISVAYRTRLLSTYVANRVFPAVPVNYRSDLYYVWKKGDWFRGGMQKRAPATPSAGGGQRLTTASYVCDVWALHDDLSDQIVANTDPALDLRSTKTEWLQQQAMITREQQWAADYFTTGKWGTDNTSSSWDNYTSGDPGDDVETARQTILANTGFRPNKLTVGSQVHAKLKFHPLIQEQFKYTSDQSLTAAVLARYFEVDEYLVADAVQNTGVEGAPTDTMGFILGKHALLTYAPPTPALNVPSAGYQFIWNAYGSTGAGMVKSFRMEELASERIEIENAWDDKLVAADLGYFWSGVVT